MINELVNDDLEKLRVVGWHKTDKKWTDLGNSGTTGNTNEGTITSLPFLPDTYEVLTFGSVTKTDNSDLIIYNTFTPNNDGVNDTFVIEGLESKPNTLHIYNRWGAKVYSAKNYQNDWNGKATEGIVYRKREKTTGRHLFLCS